MIQGIKSILKENYHTIGSGTILTILVALLYKYSRGGKYGEVMEEKIIDIPTIITGHKHIAKTEKEDKSKELNQLKILMKEFTEQIKDSSESLVYFNNERKINSNYLNVRNQLFTKDIETKNILIDTKNIVDMGYKHDTSNYTVDIGSNGKYPDSFKNVIGFRLVKCIIPVCIFHVKDDQRTFTVTVDTNPYTCTLRVGNYTFDELATTINDSLTEAILGFTVLTKPVESKYVITHTDSEFNFTFENNNLARLFGLSLNTDKTSTDSVNLSLTSDYPVDQSIHYVDLVVPEIPSIACKLNSVGQHVIDRIPLVAGAGNLNYYEAPAYEYLTQKYFYPIKLNKLTIQLYEDSENNLYTTNGRDNYFEFEITILKNTKLMNT